MGRGRRVESYHAGSGTAIAGKAMVPQHVEMPDSVPREGEAPKLQAPVSG